MVISYEEKLQKQKMSHHFFMKIMNVDDLKNRAIIWWSTIAGISRGDQTNDHARKMRKKCICF